MSTITPRRLTHLPQRRQLCYDAKLSSVWDVVSTGFSEMSAETVTSLEACNQTIADVQPNFQVLEAQMASVADTSIKAIVLGKVLRGMACFKDAVRKCQDTLARLKFGTDTLLRKSIQSSYYKAPGDTSPAFVGYWTFYYGDEDPLSDCSNMQGPQQANL